MRKRVRGSSPAVLIGVTLILFLISGEQAISQRSDSPPAEPDSPTTRLQRSDVTQMFVPAHRPEIWPKGDWKVVETQEYRRLLEGLKRNQPEPSPARISNAKYQAIFTGKKLRTGQLTATIQQTAGSQFLSLDPINLALASLWWDEGDKSQDAIWGNTADGETLLIVPEQSQSNRQTPTGPAKILRGDWTAAGQKFSNRFEFDLKLLPASVNEVELYLPRAWTVTSSAGVVEGPIELTNDSQENRVPEELRDRFRQWNIQMGSEQQGLVTFLQSSPGKPSTGLLLAESDTTYLIHERELQIEARYELEAAFAPVSQVILDVPQSIQVFAVTYGADTNLEWHKRTRNQRQQIVIDLPDPLLGKSRPLRVQGLGTVQSGRAWQLPIITCSEAALLRGELHMTVDAPLELRSYQTTGFRQTAISVQPDQNETLTFSQICPSPRATLLAFIGTPEFSVASQIVSRLATESEEWQMRSEVTWNVQAGSQFLTTCEVQPGWEILDVRQTSDSELPIIADWRVLPGNKDEPAKLTIEFLEALTPMQSKRVLVLARRLPLTTGQAMPLACVKPLSCRSVEEFLWVETQSSPSRTFLVDVTSEVTQHKFESLPASVQQSPLFSSKASQEAIVFHSENAGADDQLVLNTTEPPYNAKVKILVECTDTEIRESATFTIEPVDSPVDRLTITAIDLGKDWDWDLQSEQRMPNAVPLEIKALDSLPGDGEETVGWELR
ncbi:MAG: hypothetical protein KDA84_25600, partial [Planctomycetaceae bacterium]|nr:hypothetical protein [Planctomycetaceae bacterium]